MKFTQIATLATFILPALAEVYDLKLKFYSDNTEVNGKYLSSIHEGAAVNYFFLGEGGEVLSYDTEKKIIFAKSGNIPFALTSAGDFLAYAATNNPQEVTFTNDVITVAGSNEFYAAKNVSDPYNYSQHSWAVLSLTGDHPDSIKGQIKQERVSEPSAPVTSSGYLNTTTTATYTTTTVTYTCPSQVVITITDCPATVTDCPARTHPSVVTTVTPVTLTTTYCPELTSPILTTTIPHTEAPKTTQKTTLAEQSTTQKTTLAEQSTTQSVSHTLSHPAVTTAVNAGAKVVGGAAAGAAAIVALML